MRSTTSTPAAHESLNVELGLYKAVLWFCITPVFGVVAPLYSIQQAVVEGYRVIRRVSALLGFDLKSVEQIRFEGRAFYFTAVVIGAALAAGFVVSLRKAAGGLDVWRALPDVQAARRFRSIPPRIREQVQARIDELWARLQSQEPAPLALCFAGVGVAACVTREESRAAIALSSGLLQRMQSSEDKLAEAVLLHELAHVLTSDVDFFRRSALFVFAFRRVFWIYIAAIAIVGVVWIPFELLNVGCVEHQDASFVAFAKDGLRDLVFPYLSLLLILRYVALLVMLTELRADSRAAEAMGGLKVFAETVRECEELCLSSRWYFWRTLFGTRVTHMSAQERLGLLASPSRIFTPKYRYFGWSLALSVALILDGSLAFTDFDWTLQVNVIGSVAAVNSLTVAMMIASPTDLAMRVGTVRIVSMALVVVAINMLLLLESSPVMGTTDSVLTYLFDPNFNGQQSALHEALGQWYAATASPLVKTASDGRLLCWGVALGILLGWVRAAGTVRASARQAAVLAVLTAGLTMALSACSAFGTFLLLPNSLYTARGTLRDGFAVYGPVAPTFSVLLTYCIVMWRPKRQAGCSRPPELVG